MVHISRRGAASESRPYMLNGCSPASESLCHSRRGLRVGAMVHASLPVTGLRVAVAALILLLAHALPLANGSRSKKVIYYGWGLPDTQYVRDHWREMEEMPFDGLGIVV